MYIQNFCNTIHTVLQNTNIIDTSVRSLVFHSDILSLGAILNMYEHDSGALIQREYDRYTIIGKKYFWLIMSYKNRSLQLLKLHFSRICWLQ